MSITSNILQIENDNLHLLVEATLMEKTGFAALKQQSPVFSIGPDGTGCMCTLAIIIDEDAALDVDMLEAAERSLWAGARGFMVTAREYGATTAFYAPVIIARVPQYGKDVIQPKPDQRIKEGARLKATRLASRYVMALQCVSSDAIVYGDESQQMLLAVNALRTSTSRTFYQGV